MAFYPENCQTPTIKYLCFQYSVAYTAVTCPEVTLCCENPFDVLAIGDGVVVAVSSLGRTDSLVKVQR